MTSALIAATVAAKVPANAKTKIMMLTPKLVNTLVKIQL